MTGATNRRQLGYASRRQGFYGESVVQAIAASAGLTVSKEELEPEGIDLQIVQVRENKKPRKKRIEVQVKSRSDVRLIENEYRISLKAKHFHELNGIYGVDYDIPRYLVLVTVPQHFSNYCIADEADCIKFHHRAYWVNLMGEPSLPAGQESTTVSIPRHNVLTSRALVELVCGDPEEAAKWMSA